MVLPAPLDVLYFQAGTIEGGDVYNRGWSVFANLPAELPSAREYWIVLRFGHQSVPDASIAEAVAKRASELRALAQLRHQWNVVGLQLDIDSPTRLLPEYAKFLGEVRKGLPPEIQISITALLDWFHDGTAVTEVINHVDEFVPQFYDVGKPNLYAGGPVVAARLDGATWGSVFNRFQKRFRIGVSSFGRALRVTGGRPEAMSPSYIYNDLAPVDVAGNPAFRLEVSKNAVDELVLTYRATREVSLGYNRFPPGEAIQFILPTSAEIRSATESARKIGGYCSGVIFFRWPSSSEILAMEPDEALAAAGVPPEVKKEPDSIEAIDGGCAAVKCVDIYLLDSTPLRPAPVRYRIHSSEQLEYFLPEGKIPIRMAGPSDLELSLPPYGGRRRMQLGRAVSATRSDFTVQEVK
ncbi:MAG TPA: DUF3142 domain-containing protein [Bryobacteraceae bacterium]